MRRFCPTIWSLEWPQRYRPCYCGKVLRKENARHIAIICGYQHDVRGIFIMDGERNVVTKREAATCQLETAIKLYFGYRDLISAYTLCCAADGILEGVYKNDRAAILGRQMEHSGDSRNLRFSWKEEWEILFKPEYRKEGFRLLNYAQNFFKHADNDYDKSLEFKGWDQTGFRILAAVENYRLVFGETTKAMTVFLVLFLMLNPQLLKEGNPLSDAIKANPDCRNLTDRYSPEEISAVGYRNLKYSCPELFE